MISDFEEKQLLFETTSKRYVEVLKLRKVVIADAGGLDGGEAVDQGDESGSLFLRPPRLVYEAQQVAVLLEVSDPLPVSRV
jgi:hypothetical protein